MATILLPVLLVLGGSFAQADMFSGHDIKNPKLYGNCSVETQVDVFTDREDYLILCMDATLTDPPAIGIMKSKRFSLHLRTGSQVHLEQGVPTAIRIDKGFLIKRNVDSLTERGWAHIYEEVGQLIPSLLHDLAHGHRVAIRVGNKSGLIQLDGSQRAVKDFRRRVGLQPQQTLDIPTR